MATRADVLASLESARAKMAARLDDALTNPKPDYSEAGRSVSWASYVDMLTRNLEVIERAIARASGPWTHKTYLRG